MDVMGSYLWMKTVNLGEVLENMGLKKSCDPLIVTVSDQRWLHLVGKRLSQINGALNGMVELDMTVQLSKSEKSPLKDDLRLVGILYEGEWRFYVTNIFDALFAPKVIYELYSERWTIEIFLERYQACSEVRTHILEKQEWNYGRNLFSSYFLSSCQDYNCNCGEKVW
uniref:Uncharacterized protein n=2 Tax=Candidatus Methanogaster sp. ANME-2c ERB4 TaxID=2759911 RepID=A0A7G9YAY0_9EURY|nr:hypothetical protein GMDKAGHH_00017 [Methanosarcinales archaeon ANME-2c ERB4]QNO46034.1 hypothetical protein OOGCPJEC_00019 [Methanosarcinales archaeon ANME-2c ERB4]